MKFDLYRLFFPLGWLIGLWGAFVWVLFKFNLIEYPGSMHPEIMIGGFILPFVVGFLTTAIPKLTASFAPQKNDYIISFSLAINLFLASILNKILYFRISSLAFFIFLVIYIVPRFIKRKSILPNAFVFLGSGVFMGALGSSIFLLSSFFVLPVQLEELGRLFYFQGYILCFILGVGTRIIPSIIGLLRVENGVVIEDSKKAFLILMGIFFLSYFVEVFFNHFIGSNLRSLVIGIILFKEWQIYQLPKTKTFLSWGLFLSSWALFAGHLLANIMSNYYVHLIHIFYISGISLMTFLVASRVSLAHSGVMLDVEKKSKMYLFFIMAILLSAATRVVAGFLPNIYINHLFYAASIWIVFSVFFASNLFKKILFK